MDKRAMAQFFDSEEEEVLQRTEEFQKILTHLRYEGKVLRGRNVKSAIRSIECLNALIKKHQSVQEKVIFPFLTAHIPKREAVIQFFRADHKNIKRKGMRLENALRKIFRKIDRRDEDKKIQQAGVYLVYFLRHHIELERKSIHRAICNELRNDEKLEVKQKINAWRAHHHKRTQRF